MKQKIWKNLLIADMSGKVISVFKDVFLGIYFLLYISDTLET